MNFTFVKSPLVLEILLPDEFEPVNIPWQKRKWIITSRSLSFPRTSLPMGFLDAILSLLSAFGDHHHNRAQAFRPFCLGPRTLFALGRYYRAPSRFHTVGSNETLFDYRS